MIKQTLWIFIALNTLCNAEQASATYSFNPPRTIGLIVLDTGKDTLNVELFSSQHVTLTTGCKADRGETGVLEFHFKTTLLRIGQEVCEVYKIK